MKKSKTRPKANRRLAAMPGSPPFGWVALADFPPPRGKEVLVSREGVDANTRATKTKTRWEISDRWWCQVEANAIKSAHRGVFKPTHWWHSENTERGEG